MAKQLKLRRGSTSQHNSFTGAEGEVTVDTDKETLVVHDGSTAGGHPVAAEDMANVSSSDIAGRLSNDSIATSKIAAGTLPSDVTVASVNLVDGTVVNADIDSGAEIANSKLADSGVSANTYGSSTAIPSIVVNSKGIITSASTNAIDTTSIANGTSNVSVANNGDITTTRSGTARLVVDNGGIAVTGGATVSGSLNTGDVTVTSTQPKIVFNDSNNNPDYQVENVQGVFKIRDNTNSADRLVVNTDGHLDIGGNVDFGGGIDVTGNITVSGTVDGVDIAAAKTTLDGISTGNIGEIPGTAALAQGVTAQTQGQSDNSSKVATTAYVRTAVSNLVDSSPAALDTLNELAAAIGDDANFSTTVTNSIATKMPKSGGEFTGNITVENVTPDGDSSRNLGSNSVRFANVYADNFVGSGANLTGVEAFVSGMIILWSGNTGNIPSGFVLCNGSNSTPDLRDRFVVGAGSSYNPGSTGGSNSVTLSTTQIPSHNHTTPNHRHSFSGSTNNDTHSHTWDRQDAANDQGYRPWPASNNDCRRTTANTGNDTHNHSFSGNTGYHQGTTTSTGSGSSHENRPPYYALCYIMKT